MVSRMVILLGVSVLLVGVCAADDGLAGDGPAVHDDGPVAEGPAVARRISPQHDKTESHTSRNAVSYN